MMEALKPYFVFALVALVIFTVYIGAVSLLRKNPVRERLKRFVPADAIESGFIYEENKKPLAIFCENVLTAFGVDMAKAKRELYFPMARAGLMSEGAVAYYLFFRRVIQPVLLVLGVALLVYVFSLDNVPGRIRLLFCLIAALLLIPGFNGAKLYLSNRAKKRREILQSSLADTLDLLTVCVESGLPLDSAIARVTRELPRTHPEMTAELDRTRVELSVLGDRVQALTNFMERTDAPGIRSLVPALIQTEKYGTSIADTLRVLSDEHRVERQMLAETRAARIPVLITIPLILFIMPPIFLVIMAPPIIKVNAQGGIFGGSHAPAK